MATRGCGPIMQGAFAFYRDLPARPKRPERLFFGLLPDPDTAVRVGRFAESFVRRNRTQAGKAVAMRGFEITFCAIKSFDGLPSVDGWPRKRPLVLLGESDDALALHKTLGAAMNRIGLRAAESFTPHMTLAYGAKSVPAQAIEPIRIAVNEFALIHSALGLTPYNVVDRWRLEG
jgi:2'-5' RNA ligase